MVALSNPFDARTGALKRTYAHDFSPLSPAGPRKAERPATPASPPNLLPPVRTGGWVSVMPGTLGHGRLILGDADVMKRL